MKTKKAALIACIAIILVGIGVAGWFVFRGDPNSLSPTSTSDSREPYIKLNIPEQSLKDADANRVFKVAINTNNYGAIERVEYLVDGKLYETSTAAPFAVYVSVAGFSKGEHTLQAVAYYKSGKVLKSDIFTFTVNIETPVVAPTNDSSEATVDQSISFSLLGRNRGGASTASSHGSSSSGGSQGGSSDSGGGSTGPITPLTPNAQICGNASILNGGPTTAPTNTVTVPAGNNNGFDFNDANTTYWFAPGTHQLGTGQFAQIAPGDNSTFIGAPGAVLDGQNLNNYAFSGHSVNVSIRYLTIKNFVAPKNEGVINHNSGDNWTIEYITAQNNKGGALFLGTNNVARYNCLKDNGQYGFQVYADVAPNNVLLDHNEIVGNNTDDWEAQDVGCGCTGGGKFWDAHNVTVTNNYVHDNLSVGLWADTNDTDFLIESNYIANNEGQGLFYEISYNMIVRNNNFIRNAVTGGPSNTGFPTAAIYLSESGGDSRVAGRTHNIDIYDNIFTDNWSGVVLWENADRFCSSPANTSTGTCTLVNPAATLTTCTNPANGGLVNTQPYYSDCRWKTQNVKVHNNVFALNKDNIPSCSAIKSCGLQGIFSNSGSSPSWSPYMGTVIQTAITFNQNNLFSNNTYVGDWNFMVKAQNKIVNFAVWQQSPFSQDVGSTFNGQPSYHVANALDTDTATLEGSIGKWVAWFSDTIAQTTEQAHTGTHSLKVNITAPFGWGVQLTDTSGYGITTKKKNVSFWGRAGSGTGLNATVQVVWLKDDGSSTGTTQNITLTGLTNTWQQASQQITPPADAATANIRIVNSSGTTGNSLYLDDFVMEDVD